MSIMKETDIKEIKFDASGLVPAVAQDAVTGEVLMQAYMNAEALEKTLATGQAHYYSRSRKKLWRKGEESGHTQAVVKVTLDCDGDCVLLKVLQTGPACHTGNQTCFYRELKTFGEAYNSGILYQVAEAIKQRKAEPQEGSYTNYLLAKGADKICKKVGEEASETIIAAKNNDNNELAAEISDLIFHLLVLCENQNLDIGEVFKVLAERHAAPRKREY